MVIRHKICKMVHVYAHINQCKFLYIYKNSQSPNSVFVLHGLVQFNQLPQELGNFFKTAGFLGIAPSKNDSETPDEVVTTEAFLGGPPVRELALFQRFGQESSLVTRML